MTSPPSPDPVPAIPDENAMTRISRKCRLGFHRWPTWQNVSLGRIDPISGRQWTAPGQERVCARCNLKQRREVVAYA